MNWKDLEGSVNGLISRYYICITLEGLNKITKNFGYGSRCLGRDLNPGPPEYEAGMINARP
jgi:hypothetical protein